MENTNKKTQRDFYNEIIALADSMDRVDIVEFCEGRIEVLDKKSKNKKPTKTQEENEVLKTEILSVMSTSEGYTVTEIMGKSDVFNGLTNQKISALLRQLKDDNKVVKTMDKKKAYFTLAE